VMMNPIEKINASLKRHQVEVYFTKEAIKDFGHYDQKQQQKILALIIKRAMSGPLIKPNGIGESLHKELKGFSRIKPKQMGLRIIYRPIQNGIIRMIIIAIGPRDRDKVYKLAAARLSSFFEQMNTD
jgi:mRNA interferase RelE/StbE